MRVWPPGGAGARAAGGSLWMAALVLAGGAQFFLSSELWQARATLAHEILGAALLLPVLAHGWHFSVAARERDRARGIQGPPTARHRRRHGPPPPRSARS